MKVKEGFTETPHKVTEMSDYLDILAEDGRVLYTLRLHLDGGLEIQTGGAVKQKGVLLASGLHVRPLAVNTICVMREKYED